MAGFAFGGTTPPPPLAGPWTVRFAPGWGAPAETSFAALVPIYERRVDAVARFTEPRRWLDVGTGHAHFCLAARRRWPDATFDGTYTVTIDPQGSCFGTHQFTLTH